MQRKYNITQKAILIALCVLLAVGLLAKSVTLFCLNAFLDPFSVLQEQEVAQRIFWRSVSEKTCGVTCGLYTLGLILLAVTQIKGRVSSSAKQVGVVFLLQIFIVSICTIPFGVADSLFYGDYLEPFLLLAPALLVGFALYAGVCRFFCGRRSA